MYNEYSSLKLFSAFVIKVMKTPFNIQRVLDYYASVFFPLTIPKSVQMTRDLSPVHCNCNSLLVGITFLFFHCNHGTRTEGKMIDGSRASNNSVHAVCKSTGCTVGISNM